MISVVEATVVVIRGLSRLSLEELDVVLERTVEPVWAAVMKDHIINRHIRFDQEEWQDYLEYIDNGQAAMRGVL